MPTLAFDIGGSVLRCGVVEENGDLHDTRRLSIPSAFNGHPAPLVWRKILMAMKAYCLEHAALDGSAAIAISFPGPIRDRRYPVSAPTVAGTEPPPPDIAALLYEWTGRNVWILNDVSAAAWHISTRIDADPFMVVTISSGIGSKIFHRAAGAHVFDDVPYGGEIGHLVVDRSHEAPACNCGGQGHLGAIASGRGTEALARRAARDDPAAFAQSQCARTFGATPSTITNEDHLVPAALNDDVWVWSVVSKAMEPLAQTLSSATHAIGLKRIIIIGGFALGLGQRYVRELTRQMRTHCDGGRCGASVDDLLMLWDVDDEPCLRGAGTFGRAMEAVTP